MVWAQRAGLAVGILSARSSGATTHRAAQLGIRLVVQGVSNKLEGYERILRDSGLTDEAVAYMGDDLLDLPVLARAGLSAAPADAAHEVRERCGLGQRSCRAAAAPARELIELVLRAQQRWDVGPAGVHSSIVMGPYATLFVLLALLAGLIVGKAWERYKLQGRPVDRPPPGARVAALHAGAELPRRQPDRPGDRGAERCRGGRRRSARDSPDSRQPLSREGTGRPRHPGTSEPAPALQPAQAGARERAALPRARLPARRVRRPRARSVLGSAAARSAQPIRAGEPREAARGTAPVDRRLRDAAEAGCARHAPTSSPGISRFSRSSRTRSASPR